MEFHLKSGSRTSNLFIDQKYERMRVLHNVDEIIYLGTI